MHIHTHTHTHTPHTHTHAHTYTHTHTVADLEGTSVTCSRTSGSSNTVICPFSVAQDDILEGNEYLVFVLTVVANAGNDITLTRNCSIGRILAALNPGTTLPQTSSHNHSSAAQHHSCDESCYVE